MSDFGPVSLSELRFYASRAALGAGCAQGIAEDLATTAIWLAKKKIDPTRALAQALDHIVNEAVTVALKKTVAAGNINLLSANGRPCSAIYAGIAASDQLALLPAGAGHSVTIADTDSPLLAAAFAQALNPHDHGMFMQTARAGSNRAVLSISRVDFLSVMSAGNLILKRSAQSEPAPTQAAPAINDHHHIRVSRAGWDGILKHFNNSLVAASEASRLSGAGAGLVDTD